MFGGQKKPDTQHENKYSGHLCLKSYSQRWGRDATSVRRTKTLIVSQQMLNIYKAGNF